MRRIDVSVTALAQFACRQGDLIPDRVAGPTAAEGIRAHKRIQKQLLEQSPEKTTADVEVAMSCDCKVKGRHVRLTGRLDYLDRHAGQIQEIKSTLVASSRVPESQGALHWAQLYLYAFMFCEQLKQVLPECGNSVDKTVCKPVTEKSADEQDRQLESENLGQDHQPESTDPLASVSKTKLELRLIYVNLRDNSVETLIRTPDRQEIERFALETLSVYVDWSLKLAALDERMTTAAKGLDFPFAFFRAGQRDMAVAVFKACRDDHPLLCEAATGIGKTISSLFPAVKCLGEGHIRQIVYLVAKVSGGTSALQALHRLNKSDQALRAIQIRAKQASCFCLTGQCERDAQGSCPMTIGFYDRLPAVRKALIDHGIIDAEDLLKAAWEHQVCPFALTQQMLPWMHVVIADYNYVFDPLVRLPYFSTAHKNALLIVDEAHNLPDRARQMFSGSLLRSVCAQEYQSRQERNTLVTRELKRLCSELLSMSCRYEPGENLIEDIHSGQHAKLYRCASRLTHLLLEDMDSLSGEMGTAQTDAVNKMSNKYLDLQGKTLVDSSVNEPGRAALEQDFFRMLCRYSVIGQFYNDSYNSLMTLPREGNKEDIQLDLICLDAARHLTQQYQQFKSVVLFSATLHPAAFYRTTLGLPDDTRYLRLQSPFDSDHGYIAVVNWIDTRYRQREASLESLIELIAKAISYKPGNYMVFLPSYRYLDDVFSRFSDTHPEINTWKQFRRQDSGSQAAQIRQMSLSGHQVGFAIQGGVYAEGIDYVGDALIGVIIVGTGLPGLDLRTQLLSEQFENLGLSGFDYAYRYPGMTRVLQTAGRVIRDEQDRGIILLVDDRFAHRENRQLLPPHWQVNRPQSVTELSESIEKFWNKSPDLRTPTGTEAG